MTNKQNNLELIEQLKDAGDDVKTSEIIKQKILKTAEHDEQQQFEKQLRINKPVVVLNQELLLNQGVEKNLIEEDVAAKAKVLVEVCSVDELLDHTAPNIFVAKSLATLFVASMIGFAGVSTFTVIEFSWVTMHWVALIPFLIAVFYIEDWKDPLYNWYTKAFNKTISKTAANAIANKMLNESFTKLQLEAAKQPKLCTTEQSAQTEEEPQVVQ